jgi:hypothetical protein
VILPTCISELAYGQAIAINILFVIFFLLQPSISYLSQVFA